MATIQIANFSRLVSGTVEPTRVILEGPSGSYPNPPYPNAKAASLAGLPVKIESAQGRVIPMSANENARCVGLTTKGLSFSAASPPNIGITINSKDCIFSANLKSTQTIAQADLWASYGFDIVDPGDGTRIFVVDKTQTGAAARLIIVGFIDALAEAQGRVEFVWLDANIAISN